MARKIRLYEECTNEKSLREVADALLRDCIMIYPTDSAYALGCSLSSIKAINRIKKIKGKSDDNLSLICSDLKHISDYARVDNATFKILRDNTPAPVTYILNASNRIPNSFLDKKKSVGIRVPKSNIAIRIVETLGEPLVSTTIPKGRLEGDELADASLLYEEYGDMVDLFIDGGDIWGQLTTIVDMTGDEFVILRQGDYEF